MAKFQAGVSGNLKGRPRSGKGFDEVLIRQIEKGGGRQAKALAQALITLALSKGPGSVQALKLIVERVGGRARPAAEQPKPPEKETRTKEQIDAQLAELLSRPDVKERVQHLIVDKEGNLQ